MPCFYDNELVRRSTRASNLPPDTNHKSFLVSRFFLNDNLKRRYVLPPVIKDSSAMELPSITLPSTGNFPPGETFTTSPCWTSSTTTCSSLRAYQTCSQLYSSQSKFTASWVSPDDGEVGSQSDHRGVSGLK